MKMSLFLKIFLWFWLATALVAGVLTFITWSTHSEPFFNRWQYAVGNTMNVYTEIARQIYENEGEQGIRNFFRNLQVSNEIKGACLASRTGKTCSDDAVSRNGQKAIERAFAGNSVEFEVLAPEESYAAKKFTTAAGENIVLVLRLVRPRPPLPLGVDWRTRLLRILAVILTAGLVCYALARYLVAPILKLRQATKKLADGDLSARIEMKRRDELGQLARDFDEMAERIETLIASQKRLTRDVSHELRSPLARMNVALELAKQKSGGETAAVSPLLERIETESKRLNEMISQILTLSKLETRAEKIEKREINLRRLIEQIAADAEFEAESKGKSVKILRADACRVLGSESLLRSAFENVLRNAVRYAKEGTSVEISLKSENGKAFAAIRDYGAGVPENELSEMFRPFYRVGEARERKTGGIGLGLAITEQAVKAHEGEISAKNAPDDDGGLIVEIEMPCL
ncbi:MAG: HAMP domain-containing protein [Acidobacteriota bacterium]|nr:HAMP domain-containing protein [Acidobacteriota bacterium]